MGAAVALLVAAAAPALAQYPVSYDFSKGVIAQAQTPNAPPPGANDFSCRPDAGEEPVVLVHGLLANQTNNWQYDTHRFSPTAATASSPSPMGPSPKSHSPAISPAD